MALLLSGALDVMDHQSGWRTALPILTLLLLQSGLYVWMAPRGFEFTDESYYLLSYLHWRERIGGTSFYEAYLELPFLALGQSVAGIRVLSLLLLLACSAFFAREALLYWSRLESSKGEAPWAFVSVGMAASLFYFGYLTTLRAPSYNLLVLCSMLVSTGLLLRLLKTCHRVSHVRLVAFTYGLAIGVCGLSKATSGVLLVVVHALFFSVANCDLRRARLLEILLISLAGVGVNFLLLNWAQPTWLEMLRHGAADLRMHGHGVLDLSVDFGRDVKAMLLRVLPFILFAGVMVLLLVRWSIFINRRLSSAFVVAIVGGCVLGLLNSWRRDWWLPLLGVSFLMLWSLEVLCRRPMKLTREDVTDCALIALLFTLPMAYSFGTNMPVLHHSQMAAVFPIMAIVLQVLRLTRRELLARPVLTACLTALCLPTFAIQWRAAIDVDYTYRQRSPLGEQMFPVRLGPVGDTLLVDRQTQESLDSIITAARTAGFTVGEPMLDFTGDGPGLIYALGGRPLARAWMIGGYPGSDAMAASAVRQIASEKLRNTWLLSSDNNPRAIKGWQEILESRIGPGAHSVAATVRIRSPYRWGKDAPDTLTILIWKPRG